MKIKCPRCGRKNLIPVYDVFRIQKPTRCEECGEIIAEPEETKEE